MKKRKNPAAVSLGRRGGKAGKGKAKARTTEQARAAAFIRWGKFKDNTLPPPTEGRECNGMP